ncbi:MAG TPA: hypothetical protein PLF40_14645, partial [Kofleriaceae bacterium]|nr:hypothetical protein [Kofleriaceae bacterium]
MAVNGPSDTQGNDAQVTGAAYTSFLAGLPFFAGIPAEDVAAFAQTVLVRNLDPEQDIVVQRTYGHSMFVLVSGSVAVHATDGEDNPIRLGTIER